MRECLKPFSRLPAALAAACCAASALAAGGAPPGALNAGVEARYRLLEKLFAAGASAEAVYKELYWPEIVATGQGESKVYRGPAEMTPLLGEYLKAMGRNCRYSVADPAVQDGNLSVVWTQLSCTYGQGKPDLNLRVLYVWQRRGEQWRVIREAWSDGKIQ